MLIHELPGTHQDYHVEGCQLEGLDKYFFVLSHRRFNSFHIRKFLGVDDRKDHREGCVDASDWGHCDHAEDGHQAQGFGVVDEETLSFAIVVDGLVNEVLDEVDGHDGKREKRGPLVHPSQPLDSVEVPELFEEALVCCIRNPGFCPDVHLVEGEGEGGGE